MKGLNPHSKILQKSRDLAEMNKYDNLQSTLFRNFGKLLSFQLTMTAFLFYYLNILKVLKSHVDSPMKTCLQLSLFRHQLP